MEKNLLHLALWNTLAPLCISLEDKLLTTIQQTQFTVMIQVSFICNVSFIISVGNDAFKQVWSKITTPNVSHHKSVYYKGSIYLLDAQANSPILRLRIENAPLNTDNQQKKVLKGKDTDYISHFNKLFLDKTYSDISFCVEEQEIPAHKNILAVRCHYFHNMFSSKLFLI